MGMSTVFAQVQEEAAEAESPAEMKSMCEAAQSSMQAIKERNQEMKAVLKDRLDLMHKATGDAKVEAIAAVVDTLAVQRIQMLEMQEEMSCTMCGHMCEHMRGMMKGADKQAMMQCPMMKQMMEYKEGTEEPSAPADTEGAVESQGE
jgi:hypothetical protein